MDWDTFAVEEAVLHYVPAEKTSEEQTGLLLTDGVIALDPGLRAYFRDKIATRLSSKGMEVVADTEQVQTVPRAVRAMLANPDQLVGRSKEIAVHLHEIQSKVNSSGLLAIVLGRASGVPCVAIIKLEPERGVRYAITTEDGRHTVDLELLRNLTLTDKTKVYKTAVLIEEDGTVAGWAADDQRTTASGVSVATFFLARFLGCAPKLPAAITTYEFVKAASTSFNEDVKSAKRRSRYQVALLAIMQDNTMSIRPRDFANTYLDAVDRPAFFGRVEKAGIEPTTTFAKDTSRVNVSKFTMTFTSGNLTLVGDRHALDSTVEIPDDDASDEPVRLHTTVDDIITGK